MACPLTAHSCHGLLELDIPRVVARLEGCCQDWKSKLALPITAVTFSLRRRVLQCDLVIYADRCRPRKKHA